MKKERREEKSAKLDFGAVITTLEKSSAKSQILYCANRKKCLDYAAKRLWNGFSCELCPFKENKPRLKVGSMSNQEYCITDHLKVHCDLPDLKKY